MVRVLALAAIAGAGCAQLAGIDDTSDEGRGGNSVTVTRLSVGAEVVATPLDLTGLSATYLVANADNPAGFDRVLATTEGNGRWSADLPDIAPVLFTVPDVPAPSPRSFDFPNRDLQILYNVLEHPSPVAAPADATITLTVTNNAPLTASDAFQVYTLGSWTVRGLGGGEVPVPDGVVSTIGPVTYPFSSSTQLSNRGQLDKLTTADAFTVLRYVGAQLTGFAVATPFEQTGADTVAVTIANVAADQMLDVKLDPAKLAMRYAAVRPAVTGLAMSWGLNAAPGYLIASNTGPSLHSGGLTPTDTGVTVAYGNPFVDRKWNTIFTLATSESRSYTVPSTMLPVTLSAGMNELVEPSAGYTLELPAALPEDLALDGKPLATDGEVIAKPTRFVEVSFKPDGATVYNLQVFDLVPNAAGTALQYRLAFAAAAAAPTFHVPPETFVAGHSYTLRAITTVGGYPSIASGDFVTRSLPLAQSYVDSAVITVMP